MIWKPKEKELSKEEAIELAKKELKPYWFHTEPLFAPIRRKHQVSLYPLDQDILKLGWIFIFLDPLDLSFQNMKFFIKTWISRYERFSLRFLVILRGSFPDLHKESGFQSVLKTFSHSCAFVFDHQRVFETVYRVQAFPTVLFWNEGKILFKEEKKETLFRFENNIQSFLRKSTPGLPFPLSFRSEKAWIDPVYLYLLGKDGNTDMVFLNQSPLSKDLRVQQVVLCGKWDIRKDCVVTQDPQATISFLQSAPYAFFVAKDLSETSMPKMKVLCSLEDRPIYEDEAGGHLTFDDNGSSLVFLGEHFLYHFLMSDATLGQVVSFKGAPLRGKRALAFYTIVLGKEDTKK